MDKSQLFEYFRLIEGYIWVTDFVSLCLIIHFTYKTKSITSVLISLGIGVFIGGISLQYGLLIFQIDPKATKTAFQLWLINHEQVLLCAWYIGFVILDCLALIFITSLHRSAKLSPNSVSRMIAFAFYVHGTVNIAQYFETLWGETSYIEKLYEFGIPAINIATSFVCFSFAMITLAKYYWPRQNSQNN